MRSAFGGIKPGNPFSPYAKCCGIVILARSPIESCATPRSNPITTIRNNQSYTHKERELFQKEVKPLVSIGNKVGQKDTYQESLDLHRV